MRYHDFFRFVREREQVRLRKEAGSLRPWTKDPILHEYKFTNVFRDHDWTTRKLQETFYGPHFNDSPYDILINAALFRYFGTFEFAEAVGWQTFENFDFDGIVQTAADRLSEGKRVFTGAYVITNQGIKAPKQEVVVYHFLKDLYIEAPSVVKMMQKTRNWQAVAAAMSKITGFGGTGFMTKEITLDTMLTGFWGNSIHQNSGELHNGIPKSFPEDIDSWTPVGPGSLRGAARVKYPDRVPRKINKKETLEIILDLEVFQNGICIATGEPYWPESWPRMFPTDIQFQLCEFDKYERTRLGQGRPRSRYRPRNPA